MRKILVTAISGNVANGILKSLKSTDDILYGCDVYDYPAGIDRVIECWKSRFAVEECYIDDLLEQCNKWGITHLIPVNEQEILKISANVKHFAQNNIKVLINKRDIVETFLDKKATYERLKNITGIDLPRTYELHEFVEDGNEYIVKLRNSCGSKFLKRIYTKADIDSIEDEEKYIVQEYLPNSDEEYTVGVFSNGIDIDAITFKRKLEHGYTSFVELKQIKELDEISRLVAKNIGLKGSINIQLRKDGGKYKIFEINPRISGTAYFRHMLGFKDVLWWLDLMDGKEDYCFERKYRKAIGLRELSEKFVDLK